VKIVLVHNQYQQPGGEDVVFEQERQLLERSGHTVIPYRRSNWEAGSYVGIRRLALAKRTVWASDTRKEFASLLRAEKPQLVHVHNTFVMISPSIFSACNEAGIPVVQTLHNYRLLCPAATFFRDGHICEECMQHTLWRSVLHGCYRDSRPASATVALTLAVHRRRETWTRGVTSFIALTNFARNKLVEGGVAADKTFVKPNFVHPDPEARTFEGEYALFAGRLSPEKRVATILQAWSLLRNGVPLVIIGDGTSRKELEREVARSSLKNVTFKGTLTHEETLAAMRNARVLIFSSEWYENFPMTIGEAFACGVPVICSRVGAMQEIVDDGRTGLHFTSGDAEDLAEKVDWAWDNPERIRAMAKEARREYETKYTAEKNYPILMDIYQRALDAEE